MRLVLLGAPGSGKGTQGKRLSTALGIPKISTGDALRSAVAAGTALGQRARPLMEAGKLVPDALVHGIVEARLAQPDCASGYILDGFPRNVAQATELDRMLIRLGQPSIDTALHLRVDDDEVIARLLHRAREEGRTDDQPEVIRHRIGIYHAETRPLLDYYRAQDKLVTVEGTGTLEAIYMRITKALELEVGS